MSKWGFALRWKTRLDSRWHRKDRMGHIPSVSAFFRSDGLVGWNMDWTTQKMLSKTSRIAVVIGTYGTPHFVHLHLESLRRNEPNIAGVLVHDDCSIHGNAIRMLCKTYGVEFATTAQRVGSFFGDMQAIAEGLRFAQRNKADVLVKFSRRFLPLLPWSSGLLELAEESQYATYSGYCTRCGYGFLTNCFAMDVQRWIGNGALDRLEAYRGQHPEAYIHDICRTIHSNNTLPITSSYENSHPKRPGTSGYGNWSLVCNAQYSRNPDKLWKDSCAECDYAIVAKAWGLKYTEDDISFNKSPDLADETLRQRFARVKETDGDLSGHMEFLQGIATEYRHITGLGLGNGDAAIAFLSSLPPKNVVFYESQYANPVSGVQRCLRGSPRDVVFECKTTETTSVDINETDLLFIDTKHTKKHLQRELASHASKVRHLIVIHDTETFAHAGEDGEDGIWGAIEEFITQRPQWKIMDRRRNCHGLTVLKRSN